SWMSIFYELRANDLNLAQRLRALGSVQMLLTVSVSMMLVGLIVLPFVIGKFLPSIPFLGTATGVGVTVLAEWIAARVWRHIVQHRKSPPFAWLEESPS